jgi:hypothetical protein
VVVNQWFDSEIPIKYCNQRFLLVTMETPHSHHPELSDWEKWHFYKPFDYLASYSMDADLFLPYMLSKKHFESILATQLIPTEKRNSTYPVAWIGSHCRTFSRRERYIRLLMKYINVASYGKCINNAKIDVEGFADKWEEAAGEVISNHKFYLSFENAICDYYVTEKLVRALRVGVIPVIMGAPQSSLYVPNRTSALFIEDYPSPKALAQRLHEINQNNTLFERFFEWRKNANLISDQFKKLWLRDKPYPGCMLKDLIENPPKKPTGVRFDHLQCETKYGTWNRRKESIWEHTTSSLTIDLQLLIWLVIRFNLI